MSKNKNQGQETSDQTETETAAKKGGRSVTITHPDSGEQVSRTEYIRSLFRTEGTEFYGNRSAITAHLREVSGDATLRYQTIFAATKAPEDQALCGTQKAARKQAKDDAAAEAKANTPEASDAGEDAA